MKIVAVHQGFELYGSDRVFVRVVEQFRRIWPDAEIVAILPRAGELNDLLLAKGFTTKIKDLFVLRKSRSVGLLLDVLKLPGAALEAHKTCSSADVVYVSTTVVLDYLLALKFISAKKFVHVHELPSKYVAKFLGAFLTWSGAALIHISEATYSAFGISPRVRQQVIENCTDDPDCSEHAFSISDQPLRVLLIGRINGWKGQDLLVEAVSSLPEEMRKAIEVRFLGGVFSGQNFDLDLKKKIEDLGVSNCVQVHPFQRDPSEHYLWSDVVVVPSRKPEPFGLVAIEGMAFGRPVIAANHGGLADIVEQMSDGLKFEPNDPKALAIALKFYLENRAQVSIQGARAREKYRRKYSPDSFNRSITDFVKIL